MTAAELIELYVSSSSGDVDHERDPDSTDSEMLFKDQLIRGLKVPTDGVSDLVRRDLNNNVSTDNAWMPSAEAPWI